MSLNRVGFQRANHHQRAKSSQLIKRELEMWLLPEPLSVTEQILDEDFAAAIREDMQREWYRLGYVHDSLDELFNMRRDRSAFADDNVDIDPSEDLSYDVL